MAVASSDNSLSITVLPDYQKFCQTIAELIAKQVKDDPGSHLALPAGSSPKGYYKILGELTQKEAIDWSQVKCFAVDDYLDTDEAFSFQTFLQEHLYRHTNLPKEHRFNPRFQEN